MEFSAKLRGADEIVAALTSLPAQFVSKNGGPVRKNLHKVAKDMQKTARALAPKQAKLLEASIKVVRDRNPARTDNASERYVLGVFGGNTRRYANSTRNRRIGRVGKTYTIINAYYWRFQEFGTKYIEAKRYLRRAFIRHARTGIFSIMEGLRTDLDRIASKVARQQIRSTL